MQETCGWLDQVFLASLLLLNLTVPNWVVTGDAKMTQDLQTDRKLGPGVLGAWMEMHSSLITSFLYYSLHSLCFFTFII
jgi:hypothetical protein